jgi:hypothetical protein
MICSSNVFFINNPDPNPDQKLRLKPDPDKNNNNNNFGSTTLLAKYGTPSSQSCPVYHFPSPLS